MQILIASGLLVILGAALLVQFWTRTLAGPDDPQAQPGATTPPEPERPEHLKARPKAA
jgi:hypothetical protein